jgi:hypothetical protein
LVSRQIFMEGGMTELSDPRPSDATVDAPSSGLLPDLPPPVRQVRGYLYVQFLFGVLSVVGGLLAFGMASKAAGEGQDVTAVVALAAIAVVAGLAQAVIAYVLGKRIKTGRP